jgi:hypothetical protein
MIRNTAAARLIGSYNELLSDVGDENGIVVLIRNACMKARIEDVTVPACAGPRWNAVLRSWSTKITEDFVMNNPQRPDQEASVVTVLHSLGDLISGLDRRMGILETTVRSRTTENATNDLQVDNHKMILQQVEILKAQLAETTRAKNRYKRMVSAYEAQLSPAATPQKYGTSLHGTPGTKPGASVRLFNEVCGKPSATLAGNESAVVTKELVTISDALSGIGKPKAVTSGVTVAGELKRLWEAQALCARKIGEVPKSVLFDPKSKYFVGVPISFSEKNRYRGAMTCVAMAITSDQWKALQTQDLNGLDMRTLFYDIEKRTLLKVKELEVQWGTRINSGGKDKAKPGMNSLGIRFSALRKKLVAMKHSEVDIHNMIAKHTGDSEAGAQSTLTGYFGGKPKV